MALFKFTAKTAKTKCTLAQRRELFKNPTHCVYRSIDVSKVVKTAELLRDRIENRFPGSGLGRVAAVVVTVAQESAARLAWCIEPHWPVRITACILSFIAGSGLLFLASRIRFTLGDEGPSQLLQDFYNVFNNMLLVGVGAVFLWSWEGRIKAARTLKALHELRSLAHIVDMHQFTKDVEGHLGGGSFGKRPISEDDFIRYLTFCTDLLALLGKLSALYAQELQDRRVLDAVGEIEELSTTLSQKIWQKIGIIERSREAA